MNNETVESKLVEFFVINKSLAYVENFATYHGFELRVFKRDSGEANMATHDYIPNRINVATEKDIVVEFCGIG